MSERPPGRSEGFAILLKAFGASEHNWWIVLEGDEMGGMQLFKVEPALPFTCSHCKAAMKVRNIAVDLKTGLLLCNREYRNILNASGILRSTIWVVVSTYYKHAEYQLDVFKNSEELKSFLKKEVADYQKEPGGAYYDQDDASDLDDFIELCVEHGSAQIKSEIGWGVREVREIDTLI